MDVNKTKIGDLEVNLNHFFRYIYGGFVLCLILVIIFSQKALDLYNVLGGKEIGSSIFIVFAIIAIGTGFYTWYKNIISELFIDFLHLGLPFLMFHSKEKCVFQYLGSLGVKRHDWITALRLIRNKNFDSNMRKIYFLRHSETHVLYITSTACFIGLISWALFQTHATVTYEWLSILLFIGISMFVAGVMSDMNLCTDECSYARLIGENKIMETLVGAKVVPEAAAFLKTK